MLRGSIRSATLTLALTALSLSSAESKPTLESENIPQHVIYEVLLRSLVELPEKTTDGRAREKCRVETIAKETGLSDAGKEALLSIAQEFFNNVSQLDKVAHEMKWKVWLSPAKELVSGLSALQLDKVGVVLSAVNSINTKLNKEDLSVLRRYVDTSIGAKVSTLKMPDRIVLMDKSEMRAGKGYQHCQTTVGWERSEVYGWCVVIEDYDVSALGYEVTCSISGPGGKPSSSVRSGQRPAPLAVVAVTPLCVDGKCYDGTFTTNSDVRGIRIDLKSSGQ